VRRRNWHWPHSVAGASVSGVSPQ